MLKLNRKLIVLLPAVYIAVPLLHVLIVRLAYLEWGATLPEFAMHLSGDSEIPGDTVVSTRAITIHTPASKIWPGMVLAAFLALGAGLVGAVTAWIACWLKHWVSIRLALIGITLIFAISINLLIMSRIGPSLFSTYLPTWVC